MKRLMSIASAFAISGLSLNVALPAFAANNCNKSDCIKHELRTQAKCTLKKSQATRDNRWAQGLNTEVDNKILAGDVVAYRVRWFNGNWSEWYVTGVNDIDIKFNTRNNDMRRKWSNFYDHEHEYILCQE